MDELLDLRADAGILEMFLQRRRVIFGLLQDTLHDGILKDADDLVTNTLVV